MDFADPDRPCWINFRSWHTCFPNSEHQRGKNEVKDCPERFAKPRGRPTLGLSCKAPSPSFGPGFLRQNALQPDHLIREHGLHLLRLCVHLHEHLLLQGLDLCSTLRMVFIDSGLKGCLAPRERMHLLLQSLKAMLLTVHFHVLRRNWELGQDVLLEALFQLVDNMGRRLCSLGNWSSCDSTHGSLNVPIEHHPTIRYMVYNGYYKVMSNIPKMGHLPIPGTRPWVVRQPWVLGGSVRGQAELHRLGLANHAWSRFWCNRLVILS